MAPIVIDRHAGCEWHGSRFLCDCGQTGTDWQAHRASPVPLGDRFRVTTSADSRNKRELVRVWEVEAADEEEAKAEARIAHAPRVGYRGVHVRSVERVA